MFRVSKVSKTVCVANVRSYSRAILTKLENNNALIYGIMGTNVLVFGAWYQSRTDYALNRFMVNNFTTSYHSVLKRYKLHTLVTSMFSHMNISHLALNMVTLYFFGSQALAVLGARSFMALYFGGGITASGCHVLLPYIVPDSWSRRLRHSMYANALGASGAVSAVVAWSIFNAPFSIVYVYFVLPVPAALFGVLYLSSEFWDLYQGGSGSGNAAHIGGAAFGASYFLLKNSRRFLRR